MFVTNLLAFVVARNEWKWRLSLALLCLVPFGIIDLAFFSANSTKIIDGGWFPLVFGLLVFTVLTTWKRGRQVLHEKLGQDGISSRRSSKAWRWVVPRAFPVRRSFSLAGRRACRARCCTASSTTRCCTSAW